MMIIFYNSQMFIVEALADFSSQTMRFVDQGKGKNEQPQQPYKQQEEEQNQTQKNKTEKDQQQDELIAAKRQRTQSHQQQLQREAGRQQQNSNSNKQQNQQKQQKNDQIKYTQFKAGDKILVKETFENGWWRGHPVGKPELQGFFPSNYVKVGIKPPAPPPPQKSKQKEIEAPYFDLEEGTDWIKQQLDQVKTGPVKSDYYQGIKGYKMVKIDEKNQNILKGNHVQFDVATGLARVPIKDQAPVAKAVRQMGYYFDYHQWNQTKNTNPERRSRPDPKKKKAKKLNLKMMD